MRAEGVHCEKDRVNKSHTHTLATLIEVAGLKSELAENATRDTVFAFNWEVVREWSEQSRYRLFARENAESLLAALADRNHGVITWVKRFW